MTPGPSPAVDAEDAHGEREHQKDQTGQPRGKSTRAKGPLGEAEICVDQARASAGADHFQEEVDRKDDQPDYHGRQRHGNDGRRDAKRHNSESRCQTPPVQLMDGRRAPEPFVLPQSLSAVDGREQRADDANAAAGHDIHLDAGLVQRAQNARVIRAGRTGAGQNERSPKLRRVRNVLTHPSASS